MTAGRTLRAILGAPAVLLTALLCGACLETGVSEHPLGPIRHDLTIELNPALKSFSAHDTVTLPEGWSGDTRFLLHAGMNPSILTAGAAVQKVGARGGPVPLEIFSVALPQGGREFEISYGGTISHPFEDGGSEQARGISQTPGMVAPEGVYLAGSSYWHPVIGDGLVTFRISVVLPGGWDAVSQGNRSRHEKTEAVTRVEWTSPEPQDEIFLIAAPFSEYVKSAGGPEAMVFLRSPDEDLAQRYLDATLKYISMFESLLGPYPYGKFALIENFWETGFGMPSFTLLGPKVIRLPFIINSSYPHEILHNWWGNCVYPAYESGNWSEGLTAYLADHLIKEQNGEGTEYRMTTLQKYADYVSAGKDFPLTQFRSRHSSPSEAVGYGKALMFFHMLRRELGDDLFVEGLRRFYREKRFSVASFDDLRASFSAVSARDLSGEFDQWVSRTGAPELALRSVRVAGDESSRVVEIHLEQTQRGSTYRLRVPAAVTLEGSGSALQTELVMTRKAETFSVPVPSRPLRVDIDPEFDLFRRLGRDETPPAISQALGAGRMTVILPEGTDRNMASSYAAMAEALGRSGPDEVTIVVDRDLGEFPADGSVAVLGWENRFFGMLGEALARYGVKRGEGSVEVGGTDVPTEGHSFVFAVRHPGNRDHAVMFIASSLPRSLQAVARKLPHYHKYSYLAFEGEGATNVAKGRWPIVDSPLTAYLAGPDGVTGTPGMGKLAPRSALAAVPSPFSRQRLAETVVALSGEELAGRGLGTEGLDRAADLIARRFLEIGLIPGGDVEGSYFQNWSEQVAGENASSREVAMRNVVGVLPGVNPERAGQSVVVSAHYDHLGLGWPDVREGNRGRIHPGADDNASGVAVLLELAASLAGEFRPERSIVFVAFTGEEAQRRGSRRYVEAMRDHPVARCMGMINIDTVGRLGSKRLLVLGAESAEQWAHIVRGAGYAAGVDVEFAGEELDSSDHISFHEAGVPAIQIFTGAHSDYHRPSDTAEKVDTDGLVKVASVAREAVMYLANRAEPLVAGPETRKDEHRDAGEARKVRLGAIPDFAFRGEGFRLSGVIPGSPAEVSGLREGDVITALNAVPIRDIRGLNASLKELSPGQRIVLTIRRGDRQMDIEAVVESK